MPDPNSHDNGLSSSLRSECGFEIKTELEELFVLVGFADDKETSWDDSTEFILCVTSLCWNRDLGDSEVVEVPSELGERFQTSIIKLLSLSHHL